MSHRKADVDMDEEDAFTEEVVVQNIQQLEATSLQKSTAVRSALSRYFRVDLGTLRLI